jgi:hypothetical protein
MSKPVFLLSHGHVPRGLAPFSQPAGLPPHSFSPYTHHLRTTTTTTITPASLIILKVWNGNARGGNQIIGSKLNADDESRTNIGGGAVGCDESLVLESMHPIHFWYTATAQYKRNVLSFPLQCLSRLQ